MDDMEAEPKALLYYCETRWLYLVKVLHGIFEWREGISVFQNDSNNNDDTNLFCSEDFIQALAYFIDIFKT
jgi:hypothetical protein